MLAFVLDVPLRCLNPSFALCEGNFGIQIIHSIRFNYKLEGSEPAC